MFGLLIGLSVTSLLLIICLYLYIKIQKLGKEAIIYKRKGLKSLMVVMGSGGHTSEMTALLSGLQMGLDKKKYSPIHFVTASDDELSKTKARQIVRNKALNEDITQCLLHSITRSRSVGQSYWTSIWTTLISLKECFVLLLTFRPDLIICNGPAICVPICFAAKLLSKDVRIVFVESICRTESLSLTGKILYYLRICDHFLVQWPQLSHKYKRSQFIGLLV